ncbi:MAG TPA: hypothetical protein VF832_02940 [Longimicrobiales bacterium]
MRVPIALGIVLLLAGWGCAFAQPAAAEPRQQARLDARLRWLAEFQPDSVVVASVRLTRRPAPSDLRRLERAGLRVSTVSGVFVFVRGRARVFPTVARFSSVQYISLSRPARTQDSTFRARVSPTSGGSS